MRYLRAFFKAIKLTAQGQQIQPPDLRYPALHEWVQTGVKHSRTIITIADQHGFTGEQRKNIILHLDSRDISMETIVAAVHHNMTLEYPMLMEARIEHNLTTLYALNLNDQYRVQQLAQVEALPDPVQQAVAALAQHLQAIPPSNSP